MDSIVLKDILLATSLCADCFAVALCSSVTMKKVPLVRVLKIALIFAVIHTALLFIGWAFGDFISPGMAGEIELAEQRGIPVRYITVQEMEKTERPFAERHPFCSMRL